MRQLVMNEYCSLQLDSTAVSSQAVFGTVGSAFYHNVDHWWTRYCFSQKENDGSKVTFKQK